MLQQGGGGEEKCNTNNLIISKAYKILLKSTSLIRFLVSFKVYFVRGKHLFIDHSILKDFLFLFEVQLVFKV